MKIINIKLWKQTFYILWNKTPDEYINFCKKQWENDELDISYIIWRTNMLNNWKIIIYVRKIEDKQRMLLTLNHEIFHAVKYSLETRWVTLDEEAYAYTMEELQRKCYNYIWLNFNKWKQKLK